MINVNYGHNAKIMDDCKPLYEYSWFIETIRQYCHSINIENAVGKAIESMPEEYIIEQVCKKLIKGKDIETIADELEEDVDRIRSICEIATKFAPDYNIEAIYKALNENN